MRLRPFAPLVVVGAGLLIMTAAPRPASAEDAGAPTDVTVASVGADLLVSWQAPADVTGLVDFDLTVSDSDTGAPLLERSVDPASTEVSVAAAELDGRTEFTVEVGSEYDDGQRFPGGAVLVKLPQGLAKPEAAPSLRVGGKTLTIRLPREESVDDLTGRLVRVFRDGEEWVELTVPAGERTVTKRITGGHAYSASYQVATAEAESPFSEQSDAVTVQSVAAGPTAVKTIKLDGVDGGLQVRWSAATPRGVELDSYRVRVTRGGERIANAYTAAEVRTVLLGGTADGGTYSVTVVAKDAEGRTSSATTTLTPEP